MRRTLPRRRRYSGSSNNIIIIHIKENFSVYFFCTIIFIIGITIGVILVNNRDESEAQNTSQYITESIINIKENNNISKLELFKKSLKRNILIVFIIWILGLTFLGKYILYLVLLIFGIAFGYTFSSVLSAISIAKGLLFLLSSMLLQNIITIPSIIFLIVQGAKSFNIFNNNHSINKMVVRFTAYCMVVAIVLIASSFIESFISTNIVYKISKYL